jgi:phosphoribosylformylglycinamidine synthase I
MTFAVVTFPGSNCDRDCHWALEGVLGYTVRKVFHRDEQLGSVDAVILPGGFSQSGGIVLGICNGFQVLCEAGLLPGALVRNRSLKFVCRPVHLRVENASTAFSSGYHEGQEIVLPIAHSDGNYTADSATLEALEKERRVVFRYTGPKRADAPDGNPNGSANAIAGITNSEGNVLGMMPHPERHCDPAVGRTDGMHVFVSIAEAVASKKAVAV